MKGLPVYAASKWGVIGFTTSMAASLLLYNITWDGKCVDLFVQMLDNDFALYVIIVTLERKAASTLYFVCNISSYMCLVPKLLARTHPQPIFVFFMHYFGHIGQTRKQSSRMYTACFQNVCALMATTRCCSQGKGSCIVRSHALGRKKQAVN